MERIILERGESELKIGLFSYALLNVKEVCILLYKSGGTKCLISFGCTLNIHIVTSNWYMNCKAGFSN